MSTHRQRLAAKRLRRRRERARRFAWLRTEPAWGYAGYGDARPTRDFYFRLTL